MEMFNIIAGMCSIISLLISVFIANKVYHIEQKININNEISPKSSNRVVQKSKGKDNKQEVKF